MFLFNSLFLNSYKKKDIINTYEPSQDTYIYSYFPDTNYSSNEFLILYWGGLGDYQGSILDFNLDNIIGKDITKATLKLYRRINFSGNLSSNIRYIKQTWDKSTVTYNNIYSYIDNTQYGNILHTTGNIGTFETWDITTLIKNIANETITDYNGLYVYPNSPNYSSDSFYDSSGTYKPELKIYLN